MRVLLALIALLASTEAHSQSQWDHNGSTLRLRASGADRVFEYEKPRVGLSVTPGTRLFAGKKQGDRYVGTAYVFSDRCGALPFAVEGPVSADQRRVTLYGKTPVRDPACRVASYRDEVLVFSFVDEQQSRKFALKLGATANGFHIPHQYHGRTIYVGWPENEHTIFAIEDMIHVLGTKNDILVGQSDGINNAYAIIDGAGPAARRMIVFDGDWFNRIAARGAQYRIILAHEIGHHVCKHTLGPLVGRSWDRELEADRAGAAVLRKIFDSNGSIGGASIDLDTIVSTIDAMGYQASDTHPPGPMRRAAYTQGWNDGSSCLQNYVAINPAPDRKPTLLEVIGERYGTSSLWSMDTNTLGKSYLRAEISGGGIRITVERPGRSGVSRDAVFFEGQVDGEHVRGTVRHLVPGCAAIESPGELSIAINVAMFVVAKVPKMSDCAVVDWYAPTAHALSNVP